MRPNSLRDYLINSLLYLIALISGGLIHLSMAPYDIWPSSLVGTSIFAALLCRNLTKKNTFLLSLFFGLGMFGAGVNWLYVSIHTYGEVPAALAVLFTFGFVLLLTLAFALPWLLLPRIAYSNRLKLLCFPLFWLFSEWLRGWLFTGFPWLYLGYGQLTSPLSGWVPLLGVFGAGAFITISASLLNFTLRSRARESLALSIIGLIFIWGAGAGLKHIDWTTESNSFVPITLIQPDIPLRDKWNPARTNEIIEILETESQSAWEPGLLIWPEAALPYVGKDAIRYTDVLGELAAQSDTAMITGLLTYDDNQKKYLNSIIGIGNASAIYNKQRLVPFGEYVPLEDWLRGTMQFFNLPMSIISKGSPDQPPLNFEYLGHNFDVAPIICYEIAYTDLVRQLGRNSNILVTLSNDAWFGNSIGPQQHMQIAQARALENQKPLARATNNGVTALVDYKGNIYQDIPQFSQTNLKGEIEPRYGSTPYANIGNLPLLLLAALISLFSLLLSNKLRSRKVI